MAQDRDWTELIRREGDDELFRFGLAATEDVCPTPSVLKCWKVPGMTGSNVICHLCGVRQCSLRHILSGCNIGQSSAMQQGRYTWRHNSILLALYKHVRSMRNEGRAALQLGRKRVVTSTKFMSNEGNKLVVPPTSQSLVSVLPLFEESDDWEIQFDVSVEVDGQVKNRPFPAHIAASPQRPDGIVFSNKLKKVVCGSNSLPPGKRTSPNHTLPKRQSTTS